MNNQPDAIALLRTCRREALENYRWAVNRWQQDQALEGAYLLMRVMWHVSRQEQQRETKEHGTRRRYSRGRAANT